MPKRDRVSGGLTARTGGRKSKGAGGAVSFSGVKTTPSTTTSRPNVSRGSKLANRAIGGRERPNQAAPKGLTRRK